MWYSSIFSLAFTEKSVLRKRLAIVPTPCRKVRIGVCFNIPKNCLRLFDALRMNQCDARINVLSSREVFWVAPNIACMRRLVHSNVVHFHVGWKWKMIEVDYPKIG